MTPQLLLPLSQRWRNGRPAFRRPDSVIDTSRHAVECISSADAKAYVTEHHYSRSYPSDVFRVGLFRKPRNCREYLAGVATFSVPTTQAVVPFWTGLRPEEGCLLGRLVLAPEVEFNGETWSVARAVKALRLAKPHLRVLLAYSDPVPRLDEDGSTITPGHIGRIYAAFNGVYLGRARARTLIVSSSGVVLNERSLQKLRTDERGRDHVEAQLQRLGAPTRQRHESGQAYVSRALRDGPFRRAPHRGNHVFAWALDPRDNDLQATLEARARPRPLHPDRLPLLAA